MFFYSGGRRFADVPGTGMPFESQGKYVARVPRAVTRHACKPDPDKKTIIFFDGSSTLSPFGETKSKQKWAVSLTSVLFQEFQDQPFHNETKIDEEAESNDNATDIGAYQICVDW